MWKYDGSYDITSTWGLLADPHLEEVECGVILAKVLMHNIRCGAFEGWRVAEECVLEDQSLGRAETRPFRCCG